MNNGLAFRFLVVFALSAIVMMPGCLGPGPPPEPNQTTETNTTTPEQNNITIIVTPQENQTIQQNYTAPPPPPESQEMNYTFKPDDPVAVYFIYVGDGPGKLHGDSILIRKGDFEMLIDAGPEQTSGRVIDFLRERGVDDIDVLVSTNADPQHYGGIPAVSSEFKVEEFWWSGKDFNNATYKSVVNGIESKVKRTRVVARGYNASLDGIQFNVLNPSAAKPFGDVNNDAIAISAFDRNFSLLLLSGVQLGAQGDMLNSEKSLMECQVMQAPYYGLGAGTSGIANFLTSLKPKDVVISGGPDESAQSGGSRDPFRRLLHQYGITYYENYVGGTVRAASDGTTYTVGYFQ